MDSEESTNAERVADALLGTCNSFVIVLREELGWDEQPPEFYTEFDQLAAQCECCDWWVLPEELDGDGVCGDCR